MRYYDGHDTVTEASEHRDRLLKLEAQGKVRSVYMLELADADPDDKPYLVSWVFD